MELRAEQLFGRLKVIFVGFILNALPKGIHWFHFRKTLMIMYLGTVELAEKWCVQEEKGADLREDDKGSCHDGQNDVYTK